MANGLRGKWRTLAAGMLMACLGAMLWSCGARAAEQGLAKSEMPAFDRLELFAFVASGPEAPYLRKMVAERGTDFTPDAEFVGAFHSPAQVEVLRGIQARKARTISADRDAAYRLVLQALQAGEQKQRALAAEKYEQALQLAPQSATLHTAYAANFLLMAQGAKAERPAREAIALWPENAEAHGILALALIAEGRPAEAAAQAGETLRIFPAHKSAKFSLGLSLVKSSQYQEAIPVLRQVIVELPSLLELQKLLGLALLETGKTDQAIEQLAPYVKARPNDEEGHYDLGVALRAKGETEKAHLEFQEAVRLAPGNIMFSAAANPDAPAAPAPSKCVPQLGDSTVEGSTFTNKFFGFSYEFPKGWARLSAEASRATVEMGGTLLLGSDPTSPEMTRLAAKMGYPLLFVVEPGSRDRPTSAKSIRVTALDMRQVSGEVTPEVFVKEVAAKLEHATNTRATVAPEKLVIGGREFRKLNLRMPMSGGTTRYGWEMVTAERGFLLLFMAGGPDAESLAEMEATMKSVHFF